MPAERAPKYPYYVSLQDLEDDEEIEDVQALLSDEEDEELSTSSFSSDLSAGSDRSSPLFPETEEEMSDVDDPSILQSSEGSSDEGPSNPEGEGPSASQGEPSVEYLFRDTLDDKVGDLVQFLLLKYRMRQPITRIGMLAAVQYYEDHFPVILKRARNCLELVFGITVKEEDPAGIFYGFHSSVGLTYDSILNNEEGMPRSGILILILSIIFMEGNSASEERIWELMNTTGVYAGKYHPVYGEPRKFITEDLVEKKYLEYRQVPNSDPPRYEFLWGSRARAETSKMRVLEFLARVNDSTPTDFQSWYEDALKDEEEREKARNSPPDAAADTASSSSVPTPAAPPAPNEE